MPEESLAEVGPALPQALKDLGRSWQVAAREVAPGVPELPAVIAQALSEFEGGGSEAGLTALADALVGRVVEAGYPESAAQLQRRMNRSMYEHLLLLATEEEVRSMGGPAAPAEPESVSQPLPGEEVIDPRLGTPQPAPPVADPWADSPWGQAGAAANPGGSQAAEDGSGGPDQPGTGAGLADDELATPAKAGLESLASDAWILGSSATDAVGVSQPIAPADETAFPWAATSDAPDPAIEGPTFIIEAGSGGPAPADDDPFASPPDASASNAQNADAWPAVDPSGDGLALFGSPAASPEALEGDAPGWMPEEAASASPLPPKPVWGDSRATVRPESSSSWGLPRETAELSESEVATPDSARPQPASPGGEDPGAAADVRTAVETASVGVPGEPPTLAPEDSSTGAEALATDPGRKPPAPPRDAAAPAAMRPHHQETAVESPLWGFDPSEREPDQGVVVRAEAPPADEKLASPAVDEVAPPPRRPGTNEPGPAPRSVRGWTMRLSPREQQARQRRIEARRSEMIPLLEEITAAARALFSERTDRGAARRALESAKEKPVAPSLEEVSVLVKALVEAGELDEAAAAALQATQVWGGEQASGLACLVGEEIGSLRPDVSLSCLASAVLAAPPCQRACWAIAAIAAERKDAKLAPVWTEFVARLLRAQGDDDEALSVYRQLLLLAPRRHDLRELVRAASLNGALP